MTWAHLLAATLLMACALAAAMSVAWRIQQATGNSGWIDATWSFSVGAVGVAAALWPAPDAAAWRGWLVAGLVAIWSARLALHIGIRTRGIADDPRYAAMMKDWGAEAPRKLFWLLQAQAAVALSLTLAIAVAAWVPVPSLRIQDVIGSALLVVAVIGESVADRQLSRFASNPANRGKVCDTGLWRWSRHPNYVFEWLGWVAYPIIAIDVAGGWSPGWIALIAPALMFYILRYVSGVPPLEAHMMRTRGDAYRAYQQRTPVFFPFWWRGRQGAGA